MGKTYSMRLLCLVGVWWLVWIIGSTEILARCTKLALILRGIFTALR